MKSEVTQLAALNLKTNMAALIFQIHRLFKIKVTDPNQPTQ